MPIQDSDLLLIEDTSGASKKIAASKLKANLAANTYNNYKLLVNKPDYSSRFVYAQNMQASVGLTDYMLVERGGTSYKVTGQQIIDYFPSAPAGAAGPITDVVNTTTTTDATTVTFRYIVTTSGPATTYSWSQGADEQTVQIGTAPLSGSNVLVTMWKLDVKSYCAYYNTGENAYFNLYTSETGAANSWVQCSSCGALGNSTTPVETTAKGTYFMAHRVNNPGDCSSTATQVMSRQGYYVVASSNEYKESTLTLAGTDNLDLFTAGDAIAMVDSDGDVASYTPVTSTISNVADFVAPTTVIKNKNGTDGSPAEGTAIANLWNGQITNYPGDYLTAASGGFIQITNIDIPQVTLVEFYSYQCNDHASVNGGNYYVDPAHANAGAAAWVTAYSGAPITLNSLSLQRRDLASYVKVAAIKVNGSILTNPVKTLTFASPNQDLKFFNTGDVVQGVGTSGVTFPYPGYGTNDPAVLGQNTTKLTGGDLNGYTTYLGSGGSASQTIIFNPPIVSQSGASINLWINQQPNAGSVYLNGSTTPLNYQWAGQSSWNYSDTGLTTISSIRFGDATSGSSYVSGIQFMSEGANDANRIYFDPITVISTDTTANTMIVDGGAWTGSDGSVVGTWNQSQSWGSNVATANQGTGGVQSPTASFNGELTGPSSQTSGNTATFGRLYLPLSPAITASTVEVLVNDTNPMNLSVKIGGSDTANVQSVPFQWTTVYSGNGAVTQVNCLAQDSGHISQFAGIKINGLLLVDPGVPDAPVGETEVTGPAKSGTGNFDGNTGAVVDVTNTNQQWISNDNRLGEAFFIKSASTRTGLSILRTQAIQNAQIWQAALAPYPLRSLVIYEGNYYANSGFAPPDVDRWLDLGPI